jgi:hypothetical protein
MTQSIGAARVELVGGSRAEAVQGSKTESAIGLVVLSSGDEGQEIGGAMSQMIGGALLQKAGGNIQIAGGGKVGLIGALHKVDASGKITFKCGASEVVIDGSGVSFKTPLLNLAAGSIKLTKTVAEGPGGGAGGGGGAGPGKAKGGGGGAGAGGEGGAGSGGAGGGSGASTSQEDGKKKRGESADQSKDKKSATSPAGAKAKAEKAGPAVTAGTPNDGDKEMDKVRAEERKKGAKKALDSMKVNDNGVERPLTEAEKKEGMEMIDFDQPLTGEPNDGWMNFTDKNGKSGQLGDPSKTKSPKQPPRGNWYD